MQMMQTQRIGRTRTIFITAIAQILCGLMFGIANGIAIVLPILEIVVFKKDATLETIFTSAAVAGAALGALNCGAILKRAGFKRTFYIAGSAFFLGSLICLSPILLHLPSGLSSTVALSIGRVFIGVGLGMGNVAGPNYVKDMVGPMGRVKEMLLTLFQLAVVIGIAGTVLADYFLKFAGWPLLLSVPGILGLLVILCGLVQKESYAWLMLKQAPQSLIDNALTHFTIQEREEALASLSTAGTTFNRAEYHWIKMYLVAIFLPIWQQWIGINIIVFFSAIIFGKLGLTNPDLSTLLVDGINVVATILAVFFVLRKFKRNTLLKWGSVVMAITLAVVGASANIGHPEQHGFLIVGAIVLYIATFAMTAGPLVWAMLPDLLPAAVREKVTSYATAAGWAANLLVALTFLGLINSIGLTMTFYIYAAFSALGFFYVQFFIPETTNCSPEALEDLWKKPQRLKAPNLVDVVADAVQRALTPLTTQITQLAAAMPSASSALLSEPEWAKELKAQQAQHLAIATQQVESLKAAITSEKGGIASTIAPELPKLPTEVTAVLANIRNLQDRLPELRQRLMGSRDRLQAAQMLDEDSPLADRLLTLTDALTAAAIAIDECEQARWILRQQCQTVKPSSSATAEAPVLQPIDLVGRMRGLYQLVQMHDRDGECLDNIAMTSMNELEQESELLVQWVTAEVTINNAWDQIWSDIPREIDRLLVTLDGLLQ